MKGISSIIVMILLLLIGVSLTGLGYVTFTSLFSQITQSTQGSISTTVTTMLAQVKIESIKTGAAGSDPVSIRNIGKVDLHTFALYINDARDSGANPNPATLTPGAVGTITPTVAIASGNVVKVTTAEGVIAIQTAP